MINFTLRSIFVSTSKEAAEFYRPRPGLNPQTVGPMASTLAITLRTTTPFNITKIQSCVSL
jgi:hypothetical protein